MKNKFENIRQPDNFYLIKYYADLQNPNSLTNKLRKHYSNYSLSEFLNKVGKNE